MYGANAFMLTNPRDTGDNEKSSGAPGYYSSRIGTWNYLFTILKNINEQWTDSTPQIREWAKLVLLYDVMHFVQQQLREKEASASQQQWMACRVAISTRMTRECQDMECNDHDFTRVLHFIIDNISPRLSFFRDGTTDFRYYTREPTQEELFAIKERNLDSNLRGLNENQERLSAKKRKLAKVPISPRQKSTSSQNTYLTPHEGQNRH